MNPVAKKPKILKVGNVAASVIALVSVVLLTRIIVRQSHTEECVDLIGSQLKDAVQYNAQKWDDESVRALWKKALSYGGHCSDANVTLVGYAGGEGYGILRVNTDTNYRDVTYTAKWRYLTEDQSVR